MKIHNKTFNTLTNHLQLSLLEKLKVNNNNDNNNDKEAKQIMEYDEYKSNTNNLNVNVTHGSNLGGADNFCTCRWWSNRYC